MTSVVFTIGHSTHSQERFVELLRHHGITAVCDVRSMPYSRMNPQFNREELQQTLRIRDIAYRFLGRELGARSEDPACYEGGKVQYGRIAGTELFKLGLKRVLRGLDEGFRIALMCAEKEPLECHRTILVARHLAALGLDIEHIHADGSLENHATALARLMRAVHLPDDHLFLSHEELVAEAYRRQEEHFAYQRVEQDAGAVASKSE